MSFPESRHKRSLLLLLACILFVAAGVAVLAFGAVKHVHPETSFAGFFEWRSYVPVVFGYAY